MTNEKNKYLTIFESLHEPVVLLNSENRIENMNHAATALMEDSPVYGRSYYDQGPGKVFPWLTDEIEQFISSGMTEGRFEKELPTVIGARHIIIKMKKMLDVSEKFSGTVIILNDVTDQKEMEKRLRQMATTDSLTGIYNRGWYLSLTQEESKRSRRNGAPLSVVLADIDNFKKINDTFGHQIGDEVIRKTCVIFREQLREYDILGRLGGEEFGITMIECDLKKAASIADRLRRVLSLCELPHDGSALRFTVSLGVAQYHQSDTNVGEVLRRADRALYAAKNSGRNCVREAS
jgi:diguanylate cyclase (GGDEF)-like protein